MLSTAYAPTRDFYTENAKRKARADEVLMNHGTLPAALKDIAKGHFERVRDKLHARPMAKGKAIAVRFNEGLFHE